MQRTHLGNSARFFADFYCDKQELVMLLFYIGQKAKSMKIYPRELLKSNWPYRDALSVWNELGEITFSSSSYVSYKGTIPIICQDEGT